MTNIISKPLSRFRTAPSRGAQPKVEPTGGDFGAGLITGASAISRGEALGHGAWIDEYAVESVVRLGNASRKGVKVRFTHPGLSADGMGTLLGRMKNFRKENGRAIGDIHFAKSAHQTPDGDLAKYVMDLATEDAEAFGMSIVFDHDIGAEDRFTANNKDADGKFTSPDEDNTNNYRHIRLSKLWASDVVDEPAANPQGLFRKGHAIADEADKLCEFALGLSTDKPVLQHLSVDSERLAQYAARFLESHNLELKEKAMSKDNDNAPAGITLEQLTAFGNTLLGKMDEKISAALKPKEQQEPEQPSVAEIEKRGAERLEKLTALAQSAGVTEFAKVGRAWFDKGLSVEDANEAVKPLMVNQNPLSKDNGEQAADPLAKYKKEYAANRAAYLQMGLSEKEYITSRQIDDGAVALAPEKHAA